MSAFVTRAAMVLALSGAIYIAPGAKSRASEQFLYAALGPETSIPFGWLDFCRRYRGECDGGGAPREIDLTAKAYKDIQSVNLLVNHSIQPVSDMDHWGVVDRWDYPTDGKGDCEDFALAKRRLLIERGYPRQALLMTVVREANGDGHAVLTLRTNRGEFVLDNMNDAVKTWTMTPYRFVKRQSQVDPNLWVAIAGGGAPAPIYVSR
ncbi:transglutaminase-like cysteine peptidase [Methylosinus sp. Sm6]|uniref:transglutaminase-like cysteine peptidase n=1 Tax=Methylosinus sp. Sm6 TaxID=2866948 RepID=UPI001C997D09|nr:transglutaminase-like cysteine peptidase [Methylosinus sp. Sm6]MBY6241009.1 transglutaminase-like cysteine peptidase [Methylosinus sp. Sm6]